MPRRIHNTRSGQVPEIEDNTEKTMAENVEKEVQVATSAGSEEDTRAKKSNNEFSEIMAFIQEAMNKQTENMTRLMNKRTEDMVKQTEAVVESFKQINQSYEEFFDQIDNTNQIKVNEEINDDAYDNDNPDDYEIDDYEFEENENRTKYNICVVEIIHNKTIFKWETNTKENQKKRIIEKIRKRVTSYQINKYTMKILIKNYSKNNIGTSEITQKNQGLKMNRTLMCEHYNEVRGYKNNFQILKLTQTLKYNSRCYQDENYDSKKIEWYKYHKPKVMR